MSDATAVLYDHPGPRAQRLYRIVAVVFVLVLAAIIWFVLDALSGKGQLTADKWKPFLTSQAWTTYLLPGLWITLQTAFWSVVIALPIGALLGIGRLSDHAWLRIPCSIIVEFFRAIPVLILMVFAYAFTIAAFGVSNPMPAAIIGLVLCNGSVLAEVFRAGILSLPRGQTEASLAVGMSKTQMMTLVLLPQALTVMLPAIVSQLVVIVKDTALAGILIQLNELRRSGGTAAAQYRNLLPTYVIIAVIYLVINLLLVWLATWLEKRGRQKRAGGRGGGAGTPDPTALTEAAQAPGLTGTAR